LTIEQGFLFWCDFGPHSSHLQEGRRPALIVQADILNRIGGLSTFIVVPLTTKQKRALTFVQIEPSEGNALTVTSWAITNQIYTVSESDLRERLGRISRTELFLVKEALKKVLALS
jgi:mRNA-degrading endonuclease toxin of MazEF toxin-antitoxin module